VGAPPPLGPHARTCHVDRCCHLGAAALGVPHCVGQRVLPRKVVRGHVTHAARRLKRRHGAALLGGGADGGQHDARAAGRARLAAGLQQPGRRQLHDSVLVGGEAGGEVRGLGPAGAAGDAVSVVARLAGAREAAGRVGAGRVGVAVGRAGGALVDVCGAASGLG
jgi:hypothetical protein